MKKQEMQDIFTNRELSWLEFNRRVLDLARDDSVPLGEQLKFASIYGSNLDEFFMVRVGSLYDRTLLQEKENKTGMTPIEQLRAIMPCVTELQVHCDRIMASLLKQMETFNYHRVDFKHLDKDQSHFWKKYFLSELFPLLSPQIIDRRHPFPFLRGGEVYVGAMLRQKNSTQDSFGLIPVSAQFGRVMYAPRENGEVSYALTEELVLHFADLVFGKKAVQRKCLFRVTRNADITVSEGMFDHDIDYRVVMSELLKKRRKLAAVRLQLSSGAPPEIIHYLCEKLLLPENQVFMQRAPLDLSVGFKLSARLAADGMSALFYAPMRPLLPPAGFRLSEAVKQRDVLLHFPYQSIRPFLSLLQEAAIDPDVISIKMTLYRVANQSKIIEALCTAAENGKEVVTIVELRARFDEQNNIDFSALLEDAGCTVIYGFADYKVHSKLCLITKKGLRGNEYISQIGTGNYNEKTSEQYTDLSYITSSSEVGAELAAVFNDLAIERLTEETNALLIAPNCFKSVLMKEMDAEIEACRMGREASIIIKCNSISDKEIIEKISEASRAGVQVQMIVRGICCVKAGLPGLTENVHVRSLVGRYLEHSRIYSFGKGESRRIYIASGDFLTRNTQRRVEAGIRIREKDIREALAQYLDLQLNDNVNAHEMRPDGTYQKVLREMGAPRVDAQQEMYRVLANAWQALVPSPAAPAAQKPTLAQRLRAWLGQT